MGINPKISFWFGVWTTLLLAVAAGSIALPLGLPVEWLPIIKSWSAFLGAINSAILTALHGASSNASGPFIGGGK